MAQLQSTSITGSFSIYCTSANTGSVGNVWYDRSGTGSFRYSYCGTGIQTCIR